VIRSDVDIVIIGGGAMGLATAWWTAPRARVVVLERFDPGHTRGASHGTERIFRYLYTDPVYVAMAQAADEGWHRLERDADRQLLHRVGNIQHGSVADLRAMAAVAQHLGVKVERLSAAEAGRRWPGMRFVTDVVVQPDAGWVEAAATLDSLSTLARRAGAEVRFGSPVTGVERPPGGGVAVHTAEVTYRATTVVVTAGAWTRNLVGDLPMPPLKTTEEHIFFFRPAQDAPPTTFLHHEDYERYGLPCPDGLFKIGEHHSGDVVTGDVRTFTTPAERVDRMARYVAEWLPGLEPDVVRTATCLYTSTPTHDFVLNRVGPVVVGAGFSGHAFKFVPEIGRRLAALALDA
jgi:sarcosine oxidase